MDRSQQTQGQPTPTPLAPQPNPIIAQPADVAACRADYQAAADVRRVMDQQDAKARR